MYGRLVVVPPAVRTLTATAPGELPAGAVTDSVLSLTTVGVAELLPKLTEVAVDRLMPAIVTVLPPATEPAAGRQEVTLGPGTLKKGRPLLVAAGVVTLTAETPAPAGETAVT